MRIYKFTKMRKLILILLSVFGIALTAFAKPVKAEDSPLKFDIVSGKEATVAGLKNSAMRKTVKSVEIPDEVIVEGKTYKVTSVGMDAFINCTSLGSVVIPNSVKSTKTNAFTRCTNLKSVNIPSSVTEIGSGAFVGCTSLESIEIPNSVTKIGNGAFRYCTNLKSVNIPNSVTEIGEFAFNDCTSLKSVEIPSSVKSIGVNAFNLCKSLKSARVPKDCEIYMYAFPNECKVERY